MAFHKHTAFPESLAGQIQGPELVDPILDSTIQSERSELAGEGNSLQFHAHAIGNLLLAEQDKKPDFVNFHTAMDELGKSIPEVEQKKEIIAIGGERLIAEYGIKPELFADKTHSLFFSALAAQKGDLESQRDTISPEEYEARAAFVENATMMLALQNSSRYEEFKPRLDTEHHDNEILLEETYDRYTNQKVTTELQKAMDNGLLDKVKERLGMTEETSEDPYVLHVLDVADERHLLGMQPSMAEISMLPSSDPRVVQKLAEVERFKHYKNHLQGNMLQFKHEAGFNRVPLAWMTHINGKGHLNLPLPVAERILGIGYGHDTDTKDRTMDIATLEHEYAHTQGGLALDGEVFYGVAAEERRAEKSAGDKMGYQEIKGFTDIDLPLLSGFKLGDIIQSSPKGGDAMDVYPQLASKIGLDNMLKFALTIPKLYRSDTRPAQQEVNEYIGGIDGLLEDIYNDMPTENRGRFEVTVEEWAKSQVNNKFVDQWLNTREMTHGLSFVTQKLRYALTQQRQTRDQTVKNSN